MTTTTNHPREYRVTRYTPGIKWGKTISYHRTRASVDKAIAEFFEGRGKFGLIAPSGYYSRLAPQSTISIHRRNECEQYELIDIINNRGES